jgi:hypothetical protein
MYGAQHIPLDQRDRGFEYHLGVWIYVHCLHIFLCRQALQRLDPPSKESYEMYKNNGFISYEFEQARRGRSTH